MRRRGAGVPVEVPAWVRLEGFKVSDWAAPEDFALPPELARSAAWHRWNEASNRYLTENPAVFDELMDELRRICRDNP